MAFFGVIIRTKRYSTHILHKGLLKTNTICWNILKRVFFRRLFCFFIFFLWGKRCDIVILKLTLRNLYRDGKKKKVKRYIMDKYMYNMCCCCCWKKIILWDYYVKEFYFCTITLYIVYYCCILVSKVFSQMIFLFLVSCFNWYVGNMFVHRLWTHTFYLFCIGSKGEFIRKIAENVKSEKEALPDRATFYILMF